MAHGSHHIMINSFRNMSTYACKNNNIVSRFDFNLICNESKGNTKYITFFSINQHHNIFLCCIIIIISLSSFVKAQLKLGFVYCSGDVCLLPRQL